MRRFRAALLTAVLLVGLAACDSGDAGETFTLAFLRALPTGGNDVFLDEMAAGGFIVGENLRILGEDPEEAYPDPESAKVAVERWVDQGVDLIVAFSTSGADAARQVTDTVPILFLVNDPMAVGLVEDEQRPEANLTGVTFRAPADRTLELVRAALPGLSTVGVLSAAADPATPAATATIGAAAEEAGVTVVSASFPDDAGVEAAVATLAEAGVDAVYLANAPTVIRSLSVIEPTVAAAGLPLVTNTDLAQTVLVGLTPDADSLLAQLGRQAARILDGAKVSSVPVEDPRSFRLVLGASQARILGLGELPVTLTRQADEVR